MKAGQIRRSKLLATLIAHQRFGYSTCLECLYLSLGVVVVFGIVLGFGCRFGLNIFKRLVLVILEPLQGALNYIALSVSSNVRSVKLPVSLGLSGGRTSAALLDGNFSAGLVKAHIEQLFQIGSHCNVCFRT